MSVANAAEVTREAVKKHSAWYLVQGALMVLAGALALLFPSMSSMAVGFYVGWLLIISAVLQAISLIDARDGPHFWLQLLSVALFMVVGLLFLTGSSFPYAAADGALAGGGFLEGDLLADPPALAQLELSFCQRHNWNFARLLPLDEHPRSGAVAAWRPPWYSAHLRGHGAGCSRLAGALGLMAWRAAASL